MTDLPPARQIRRAAADKAADRVTLDYDGRLLRRKRLTTEGGRDFLVDLKETVSLDHGDCFECEDGTLIAVAAADEPLLAVTGDLPRLAWHIGNRHTPCQIEADRLLIREDKVLAAMLEGLGASLSRVTAGFTPEGGAYGHGRTMGHDHGYAHEHGHDHSHEHHHEHGHSHDHAHTHVHHHSAHHHSHDDAGGEEGGDGDEPEVIR
ncbi:urease accessory protein UreE [Acidimangrovimonas sediminis]|uniref:urease accessory protein UreE n=1 Tax=Acidimangrovimonas sediminis TaxID=2056283 RepID=UPI000C80B06B|nr:urease accessory protein UreE [Acidimangrovimonas sediminis]